MATKKYIELQDFTVDKLRKEIEESEVDFNKLRFEHAAKGLDNPLRIRESRRDLARLKTELRKRELSELSDEAKSKRDRIRKRRKSK